MTKSQIFKIIFFGIVLFSSILIFGIFSASKLISFNQVQKTEIQEISFSKFVLNFLLATLFLLIVIRFVQIKKIKGAIFKTLFLIAVFFGGFISLSLWLGDFLALILIVILIFLWTNKPLVLFQDILIFLAIAGLGSILGLGFKSQTAITLLIFFSAYDLTAVYKTKHMVEMAKAMVESKSFLGLIIPSDLSGFKEKLGNIEPGGNFLILGGGDIALPLILCVSLVSQGFFNSLVIVFFSTLGLLVNFYIFISRKNKHPIPALPAIAIFSIIGYLITKIL